PQLFVLLPDFILGYHIHVLIHLAIAAIGMYALLRQLGGCPAASFVGAFSFALGGLMVSFTQLLPFLFSASWLPWAFFFAARFHRRAKVRDAALAAIALAMQVLIGEPIVFLQTCALLLVGALVVPSRKRNVFALIAVVIAALLIGAVQLVPAVDFAQDTVRGVSLPFVSVAAWSLPPVRPIELLFPSFAGRTINDGLLYYGGHRLYGRPTPYLYSIYLGLVIAVAAIAGFLRRSPGWKLAAGIVAASYVLALGSNLPLLKLLYNLHLVSWIRFPEKLFLSAVFAIAVFGTLTLQRIIDGDPRLRRTAIACAAAVSAVAAIAFLSTYLPGYTDAFVRVWSLAGRPNIPLFISMARHEWLVALARGGVLALAIWLFRSRPPAAIAALIALTVVDLGSRVSDVVRRDDRVLVTPPPILRELPPANRIGRIYNDAFVDRVVFPHVAFRPEEQYWIRRDGLYPFFPALWGQATVLESDVDNTSLLNTAVFRQLAMSARQRNDPNFPRLFLDFAGVDTVLAAIDERNALARAPSPDQAVTARVIRVASMPRYGFASSVVTVQSPADVEARILAGRVPRGVAFAPVRVDSVGGGVVNQVRETASSAILDVTSQGVGYLVASVTFHRYWRATIDGMPARIIPTNVCFQGLIVPPGRHEVRLTYRNPLIGIGAAVSLIVLCLGVATALLPARAGRRA
ncbi:MAG: hypothetical protein ACXV7D_07765, partial [Thermoanaerobaculia bacterium]